MYSHSGVNLSDLLLQKVDELAPTELCIVQCPPLTCDTKLG